MTCVAPSPAPLAVVRRHNPYAMSFDGSLSASFDRSQPRLTESTRLPAAAPPSTTPFVSTQLDASNFDVHSESSGDHLPSSSTQSSSASRFDAAEMMSVLEDARHPVDIPCPAGAVLTVYNGDISQHFNLASETFQITRGSIKYADHHARYGSQTRFRFQLCHNYLEHKCAKLSECSYIHATVLPKPSEVHLNPFAPRRLAADRHGHGQDVPMSAQDDPNIANSYETLAPGMVLRVFAPNDNGASEPQSIPSEMIIVTAGALAARRGGPGPDAARPRHCAHYQFKRLCNLGTQCHFIHSKIPFSGHTAYAFPAPRSKPTEQAMHPQYVSFQPPQFCACHH